MGMKIRLDTTKDAYELVAIANKYPDEKITVTDGNSLRVNAKSVLGALYAMEFDDLWLESENHSAAFLKFYKEDNTNGN